MPANSGVAAQRRRPRKSLGQHFLTDGRVANRIVNAAEPTDQDLVLEIGPGTGMLTRRLVERAGKVVALELDQALAEQLPSRAGDPENLDVVHGDARETEISQLVGESEHYKMVANLPYYAASPIVRRFLEADRTPSVMVVMVQREVADAMAAAPGSMTMLSVATQYYAVPSVVVQVPPRCFRPAPKVSSTVIKLAVRPEPAVDVPDVEEFFALVRSGFTAQRKKLRNSLAQGTGMPVDFVDHVLTDAGIDPERRPATLSLTEWADLGGHWPDDAPRRRAS